MMKFNRFWKQLHHFTRPTTRFLLLITFSCTLVVTFFLASSTAQFSAELESSGDIGWEFAGSRELNKASIQEIEYDGECPGKDLGSIKAWFTSSKTPPAPKRRVVVKNVTKGLESDPYPYTDREYQKGKSSEGTQVAFGTKHRGSNFAVMEGENEFQYEIKENKKVIDSGSFTAVIDKKLDVRRRDATVTKNSVCFNSAVALNVCADIRTKTAYTCPNNKILRSIFEPNNPEIYTIISNQMFGEMVYVLNGNIHTLRPGEEKIYTGEYLNIQFNSTCRSGCSPTTPSQSLQPGKRYQFKSSGISGSKIIQLVDFPR
ncbi:hypothetical protein H6G26_09995 [Nostoc sp. FACHB-888]|nr:hypothetical protein [Nostoc sp. FACHB-888]